MTSPSSAIAAANAGVELKSFFGSQSAKAPGSYNLSGVAMKRVDLLIDKIITAKNARGAHDGGKGTGPGAQG